jgi:phytoene dehydrogenase-like protein
VTDAVVLGGGHNGLVLAAYLARAGLAVVVVERRHEVGGGLATLEEPTRPGFLHNPHAFFLRGITRMRWYRDLDLEAHGARLIEPELNVAMVTPDERVLHWWRDIERTAESVAAFSRKDADRLLAWHERFRPIVEHILEPEAASPPLPASERRRLLGRSAMGRRLLETAALSPLAFVKRELEHPVVQAGLLFFNGLREVDLRLEGFGHHIPALLASRGRAQMAVGGSAALARALERAVTTAGGRIRTAAEPEAILVEQGRVAGVRLAGGEVLRAPLVVSSLNPQQTFLDLLDGVPGLARLRARAQGFRYNLIAPLFGLHLDLAERPRYRAEESHPELEGALMVILGLDRQERFLDIVHHHESGTVPPTVMWGACPTRFDPSQAPAGRHTAFMWEKLPFRLGGDPSSWDLARESHGERMLALWRRHAPNLEGAVLARFTRSPLDVTRMLPNMRDGDLLVGAFAGGQVGDRRPFEGAGRYRTAVPGLYLCGSCCHPGGNVTGLPGYNAAQVVLADLGLEGPLPEEPLPARLARLADRAG